jgi:hypothetical protein
VCAKHTKERFMKNKLLSMGMLAGLLALALVMFGCDHNPRPWNGESGGGVDGKLVGGWWFQKEGGTGTLSITGGGEIQSGNDSFAFTASGGIIKVNMEGQIIKGEYSFPESGTLSLTGIPGAPEELYTMPPEEE